MNLHEMLDHVQKLKAANPEPRRVRMYILGPQAFEEMKRAVSASLPGKSFGMTYSHVASPISFVVYGVPCLLSESAPPTYVQEVYEDEPSFILSLPLGDAPTARAKR
jgi:hypothetical protein